MSRYTGPKTRIARRFGQPIYGPDKILERKNYSPGQHGRNRKKKLSEYGVQLYEKQKCKYIYGIRERQFRNMFLEASRKKGNTGEILLQLCESRLDNVVYKLGFCKTRAAARQLVNHRHITVNDELVTICSFKLKIGDVVAICNKSKNHKGIQEVKSQGMSFLLPEYLSINEGKGKLNSIPKRDQISEKVNEQLIVELYSK